MTPGRLVRRAPATQHGVDHVDETDKVSLDAGLFHEFAQRGVHGAFAPFDSPAGQRPTAFKRGLRAAHQQHLLATKADDADGGDGRWRRLHRGLTGDGDNWDEESRKTKHLGRMDGRDQDQDSQALKKMRAAFATRIWWTFVLVLLERGAA